MFSIGPSAPVDLTEPSDTSCQKLILTEIYVEVAVGDPEDFGPEASIDDVAGETVDGIGDEATWFPSVPRSSSFSAPHEAGILAVRHGEARLRFLMALPDVPTEQQLETARTLAAAALIHLRVGDAEVIVIDHPEPDPSTYGLVDNLLAKEEQGEWTRGEGLVATLRLILGEADESDVLVDPDIEVRGTTSIARLASLYLSDGDDQTSIDELTLLLNRIFPSDDALEQMSGSAEPTASLGGLLACGRDTGELRGLFHRMGDPAGSR